MRHSLATASLIALIALLAAGCGSARRGVPVQPPLLVETEALQTGERVFMRFCNGCHPGGRAGVGFALNNKPLPGFMIRFQVRHGLGVMPSFDDDLISDEELRALSRYVIALRRNRP